MRGCLARPQPSRSLRSPYAASPPPEGAASGGFAGMTQAPAHDPHAHEERPHRSVGSTRRSEVRRGQRPLLPDSDAQGGPSHSPRLTSARACRETATGRRNRARGIRNGSQRRRRRSAPPLQRRNSRPDRLPQRGDPHDREFRETEAGSSGNYPNVGSSRKSMTCGDLATRRTAGTGRHADQAQPHHHPS